MTSREFYLIKLHLKIISFFFLLFLQSSFIKLRINKKKQDEEENTKLLIACLKVNTVHSHVILLFCGISLCVVNNY